jgi:hypothetical protein
MLEERFQELNDKLDTILTIHRSLPQWYPITREFATECGYKTVDGLRKWCYNNLNPCDFLKRGKLWYINIKSLPLVKVKVFNV